MSGSWLILQRAEIATRAKGLQLLKRLPQCSRFILARVAGVSALLEIRQWRFGHSSLEL
jgi:hypothetical protein